MSRFLIDTNVFLYARGKDHEYRESCRAVLRSGAEGLIRLEASVELVQEFTHVLLRRGVDRAVAVTETEEVRAQCLLHAFDEQVLRQTLAVLRDHHRIGVRDAVHAATALSAGIERVITVDRVFDAIDGLARVDPMTSNAVWNEA